MKYDYCPSCDGKLGIPDKLLGHPVTCPKCEKVFLPDPDLGKDEPEELEPKPKRKKSKRRRSESKTVPKPAIRALPVPTALSAASVDSDPPKTKSSERDLPLAEPKNESTKESTGKSSGIRMASSLTTPSPRRKKRSSEDQHDSDVDLIGEMGRSTSSKNGVPKPEKSKSVERPKPELVESELAKQTTARIIKNDSYEPQLTTEGELPTLQLTDEQKPKTDVNEIKTNPVFLGLLICGSLLISATMLFFIDFGGEAASEKRAKARLEIQKFYEVRRDVPLKPYQLELRQAQLSHSKGDRSGEIDELRKVMGRFRAEDRNPFVGVTGSPTADVELERLVSILLGGSD